MKESREQMKRFYQMVSKACYAIAKSDKVVHKDEKEKLKEDVKKHWLALEDSLDEFGSDAAFQIEIVFDWLVENEPDPEECMSEFAEYYKANSKLFNPEVKAMIWKTANAIAESFSGKNKSELVALGKLGNLLR
ncbi:MAG: hypothetical protein DWQ44_03210 [Bacteroidetes bacterium]|nr:MAG: hypothetical protein DWQ33_04595 [Bacteroidota bacterium]REJ99988.1 MAG: hypothetical protein DWQ39_13865 [Bacteroidota bacterium]REK35832.1 MAG: hypothetical protein DWQ44_03210 [Bacteroidota bacterium]REK49297.1 MAG: hypothetical protein DWQ48_07645 [Bacteroidota bacterium]